LPADLYLEGSDQHRGWFNSSLVIGTAVKGGAPYKQVLTHGFVTDEQGYKQSKRSGTATDPVAVCEQFGADVLRLWLASVDYANDVPCSDNLLRQVGEQYRSIRNTLRFLLGNLQGYEPTATGLEPVEIDAWIRGQMILLTDDCLTMYRRYDFSGVATAIANFCNKDLSRFYLDAIKDRMYCEGKDSALRKSGQRTCAALLTELLKLLAPLLAHTTEEVWGRMVAANMIPGEPPSVHMSRIARDPGGSLPSSRDKYVFS
jgi:isoleucyl-tRNA synthetase